MGGNSGIRDNLCLPTIMGISVYYARLRSPNRLSMSSMLPTMVEDLLVAHPKIFHGTRPQISNSVPNGWYGLLNEFCLLLENICAEDELSHLQLYEIMNDSGCLILKFSFDCEVSERLTETIDARVFALRNRSVFTCVICGRLADTLTAPVLCAEHIKSDCTSLSF